MSEYEVGTVVLALDGCPMPEFRSGDLTSARAYAEHVRSNGGNHTAADFIRWVADQIESQTKPLRIPEPGLWGVVEASPSKGSPTPRRWVRYGTGWRDAFANHLEWDDLIDPTLIREGVESDA